VHCRKTCSVDRVIELTGLDHKCLREAKGKTLVEDERPKVCVCVGMGEGGQIVHLVLI